MWYLTALSAGIAVFGLSVWGTMRVQLTRNREEGLDRRLIALAQFLEKEALGDTVAAIQEEAREYSTGLPEGHGLRVYAKDGTLLYSHPGSAAEVLTRRMPVIVRGMEFELELTAPLDDFYRTLSELQQVLILLLPAVVLLAGGMGWWLAGLALRPVDAMTQEARAIEATNLGARLTLPGTGDELQRLAEAWNALLARIEASVKTVTRFTSDAAHELRTPLAVIRTTSELALRQDRSPEDYRKTMASILRETESMSELVEQLLLLAREDSGQWQFRFDAIRVGDAVRTLKESLEPLARNAGTRITWKLPAEEPLVWADESALRRMLLILVDNAMKYSGPEGRIEVRLLAEQGETVLEVQDDGPGISPEHLPHIFERFYRADPARTAGEGAGLGLAIAQAIVEAHRGRIEVRSRPGQGTLARVTIPAVGSLPVSGAHLVHS
jgi:heavy metal sensor kinase